MKMKKLTAIAVAALLGSLSANATVIFQDTFDGATAPGWGNLGENLAARQAGGTTGSAYTIAGVGPLASALVGSTAVLGENLVMRVQAGATATAGYTLVDMATDFGPSLVGQEWTMSFSQLITGNGIGAGWCGFSVGVNNPPGTPFANGFGFILADTGGWTAFNGGAAVGSGSLGGISGGVAHKWYDLAATFNETASTVSLDYTDVANGTINLGTFSTSFGAAGERFAGFRNHRDGIAASTYADMLVDDLQIEVIPEPATLGLFALVGGGMLWFRKRFSI